MAHATLLLLESYWISTLQERKFMKQSKVSTLKAIYWRQIWFKFCDKELRKNLDNLKSYLKDLTNIKKEVLKLKDFKSLKILTWAKVNVERWIKLAYNFNNKANEALFEILPAWNPTVQLTLLDFETINSVV